MKHIAFAIATSLIWVSSAAAHSALKSSTPSSGSVLTESPAQMTLTFGELTRLTAVSVASADGERRLAFTPPGSATTYTIAAPNLSPGRNEIVWRVISRDGHPVTGSIIIVIRPASQ